MRNLESKLFIVNTRNFQQFCNKFYLQPQKLPEISSKLKTKRIFQSMFIENVSFCQKVAKDLLPKVLNENVPKHNLARWLSMNLNKKER